MMARRDKSCIDVDRWQAVGRGIAAILQEAAEDTSLLETPKAESVCAMVQQTEKWREVGQVFAAIFKEEANSYVE